MLKSGVDLNTILIGCIFIGALAAFIAHYHRGRKSLPWFFLGFFFGCLAIIVLLLLPKHPSKLPLQPLLATPNHPMLASPKESLPMTQELWYFLTENQEQMGPMSFIGLKKLYMGEKVSKSSYVWNSHLTEWKRLEELPEYVNLLEEPSEQSTS